MGSRQVLQLFALIAVLAIFGCTYRPCVSRTPGVPFVPTADPCAPALNQGVAPAPSGAAGAACGGAAERDSGVRYVDGIAVRPPSMRMEMTPRKAQGQTPPNSWKRSQVVPNTSKLAIGDEDELPLEGLQATVDVDGFRARVVLDLFFRNDRDKQLEGTFKLRLPDGAMPYYLAFGGLALEKPVFSAPVGTSVSEIRTQREETWASTREARMVPREKAAHAYAETVRKAVDPALLEWAGAGIFSARVFPLEPQKLHRIVVGYEVNLLAVGGDLLYRLDLPRGVPQLEVDLSVRGEGATVTPETTMREGRYHWRDPSSGTITVRLPDPGGMLLAGSDPQVGDHFAVRFTPELPDTRGTAQRRAVFLVDVSASSNPEHMNVWLALLEAILTRNRPGLEEFTVAFFGVETFWWREGFQANTPENVAALKTFAGELALEGATDLGQALAATQALDPDHDVFLLSDGAVTWGEDDPYMLAGRLGPDRALFAYLTGLGGTDVRTLAHLARDSGGAVFSVTGVDALDEVAVAHTKRPWTLRGVKLTGGEDLILAGRPQSLYPGQVLVLAGRGRPAQDAPIELSVEQGDTQRTVRTQVRTRLDSALAVSTYGQIAVGQLEVLGHAVEEVSRAYALHYRVVGKTCSLLMLESEEDYERFGIRPQENAFLIGRQPSSGVVADTLRALGASLGDPRAAFMQWFERLQAAPGVEFSISEPLRLALAEMPDEVFRLEPEALTCKGRTWSDVGGAAQEQLASRELTYDVIVADAEARRERLGSPDGLKALSSLVEHHPGDLVIARDVAYAAMASGLDGQAYHLLRRVASKRPHQLPIYRQLALCLEGWGKTDMALVFYEIALSAVTGAYGDFRLITSFDYLRFLREIERGERTTSVPEFARARLASVAREPKVEEADLVIIMGWNTDRSDVDLHVLDPRGEDCYYGNRDTKIGGHLTQDVVSGYGPEMFVLRRAVPGLYQASVHYFQADTLQTTARSKVYVTVYEDWGRPHERVTRRTITLSADKERAPVARIRRPRARN